MFSFLNVGVGAGIGILLALFILVPMMFRTVVSTNDIHIIQSAKTTIPYGKDQAAGNTYYNWPAWLPVIGIRVIKLPVSVFDVDLDGYAAYDKGRVPFVIDIMAFFRITDPNTAAQRVSAFPELEAQLQGILQGAVRSILATSEIEEILEGRGTFGEKFTTEVDHNLQAWGVQTVKCIELMDIRDAQGSKVIDNIMAKKKSLIDKESRVAVAENQKLAQLAEIEATQMVDVRKQEAAQLVGQRTAEKDKQVGISNQLAAQEVKEQEKATAEKQMAIIRVQSVRQAEINKDVQVVLAEQTRQTNVIQAEGQKKQTVIIAEGSRDQMVLNAEGITAEGTARGNAEQALLMAPVNAQTTLAKEIGTNEGYQKYLVEIRVVEKDEAVGVAQAKTLENAEMKIMVNSGDVVSGLGKGMDVLTGKGGSNLGQMVEAFAQTPAGAAILNRLGMNPK